MTRPIRIGTRGSQLALWQAGETARLLSAAGYSPRLVVVKTSGDKHPDVPLSSAGGKGLFIKELEEALERRDIDLAVHSLKDVPSQTPDQFVLAAFLERADPRDAWLHRDGTPVEQLPAGSVVGTSAPRRRAQLIERYPHLRVEPIRGNVDTRIEKMRAGRYDGIVLAAAGLIRLARAAEASRHFTVDEMVPAAGQGIVAIECHGSDGYAREAASSIDHAVSAVAARAERAVLQCFGERLDCDSAIAVHATQQQNAITIRAFCADYDGTRSIRTMHSGSDPQQVVESVYRELVERGAMELVCAGTR